MSDSEEFVFPEMTAELQAYLRHRDTYRPWEDPSTFRAASDGLAARLPEGLLHRYQRAKVIWTCRDGTARGEPEVRGSPSGRYRLEVTEHATEAWQYSSGKWTQAASWAYAKGRVYRNGALIAEVCRNYGAFPFLFVEGHPNGHDYLVCGEDYQGQTVVELDTGRRRDVLSPGAEKGVGFCWASYVFHKRTALLIVEGCYWACPYEFAFFDFSDPMEGWPLLETAERFDADMKPPVIQDDGTILTFETTALDEDGDLVAADKPQVDGAIKTFRREAGRLVLVSESVSEEERERRRQRDEAEAARKAWRAEFEATDPLYLALAKRLEDPWLTPEDWMGVGVTHDKWCPFFSVREPRWWRRIAQSREGRRYTLDLEWAIETGPVKLVIYDGGRHVEDKFYPHSVDGMNAAFDHAKSLLCSGADGPA